MATIAWIEDDISIIDPVVYPLERKGHIFIKIGTIKEAAVRIAEIAAADLLILDLLVPVPSDGVTRLRYPGLEFLDTLRRSGHTLPVIILTVIGEDVQSEIDWAVEKVLRKPVLPSVLEREVERILVRSAEEQAPESL